MSAYAQEPGLMTDMLNPFEENGLNWPTFVAAGYKWASFQVFNPQLFVGTRNFDLAAVKKHGFKNVGVWGVIYDQSQFYNGGLKTGEQAVKLGANHLIINAEYCMKNTMVGKLASVIIKGCRDAGWSGPVDLCTYGAPANPDIHNFQMDTFSFTETDGSILCEDYYNDFEEYLPALCRRYWNRIGIKDSQLNHMIGMYPGLRRTIDGAEWSTLLNAAGIGRNFSLYMAQNASKSDLDGLKKQTEVEIINPPLPIPPSTEIRTLMKNDADKWLIPNPGDEPLTRIRIARRIVQDDNTDAKWNQIREKVKALLDSVGIT